MKMSSMRVVSFASLLAGVALGALTVLVPLPVQAHHAFSAEFDDTKPVKVTGVVTKVEWMNPHIWFYVDEKNEDGTVHHWAFSGGAPGQLMRRGVTKDNIQPGMTVKVEGFRAKDGSDNANGNKVTFPDGRMVFTSGQEPGQSDSKRDSKN